MLFSPARLQSARKASGKSREQLAVATGRSYPAICQYESGVSRPSLAALEDISDALGIRPGDLFDDDRVAS